MIGSKQQPQKYDPDDFDDQRNPNQPLTTADMAAAGKKNQPAEADFRQRSDTSVFGEASSSEEAAALLDPEEAGDFRHRWERIQTGFVDEPRSAVEQADKLVAATMSRLAEVFATEREKLEQEWDKGEAVSTEDLRLALRRYRSFFDRLLSV